jgi:hypothetical protein
MPKRGVQGTSGCLASDVRPTGMPESELTGRGVFRKLLAREIDRDQFFDCTNTLSRDELLKLTDLLLRWVNAEELPN